MKEGRKPFALYYMLTGELQLSQLEYDPADDVYVDKRAVGTAIAGESLGELSLLHNIPWTSTGRTTSLVQIILRIFSCCL